MQTISLGKTNLQVSSLCLGTMHFGSRESKETSYRILDQYIDAGGSFLDTANQYAFWLPGFAGGESETLLGKWMRERKNRERVVIATKVGFPYLGVEQGLRASQIEAECEKSLKRLGIETINLYYAHGDDRHTPLEETIEAFSRLVQAGKVQYIGASNFVTWRLAEACLTSQLNGCPEYCCIQQRYSYVQPRAGAIFDYQQVAVNAELLDYCEYKGIGLLAYSVLLNGAYTRADRVFPLQYLGSDLDVRLATVKRIAQELGVTVNQVILAWMVQGTPRVIPVIGASSVEQLAENIDALRIELSSEQMDLLNTVVA